METRNFSAIFSESGPYATALVDVSLDSENAAHELELRSRAVCDSLREQGADGATVRHVEEALATPTGRPAPVSRLVVAGSGGVLVDELGAMHTDPPVATYGPLPDLARWIAHRDGAQQFVLAVVDHAGGDVGVYDSDVPEPEEESSTEGSTLHLKKVPVGGWSALRYLHTTENVWRQNADEVVDEVVQHIRAGHDLVLVAGDPYSRSYVADKLEETEATVVRLESGTRSEDGGDEALQQAIREALMEQAVQRRLALAHELKDRLGRDHAVATGARDVADAFVRGQVETLVLDPDGARELTVELSQHPGLAVGDVTEGEVRADLALVGAAVQTGADVAVSRRSAMTDTPVAAMLRWDQDAVGSKQS